MGEQPELSLAETLWVGVDLLLLCVQDAAGRRDGVPDAGLVRLGEHLLRHRLPVWTLGPGCLAVLPDWWVALVIPKRFHLLLTDPSGRFGRDFLSAADWFHPLPGSEQKDASGD